MRFIRSLTVLFGALAIVLFSGVLRADEYSFDLAEVEKKPYYIGGYAELRPVLYGQIGRANV